MSFNPPNVPEFLVLDLWLRGSLLLAQLGAGAARYSISHTSIVAQISVFVNSYATKSGITIASEWRFGRKSELFLLSASTLVQ